MIKTDGKTFYMTCGEVCYIADNAGGRLRHICCGARVEPEDDMTALGIGAGAAEIARGDVVISRGGKKTEPDFVLTAASICDGGPVSPLPVLKSEETLKLVLDSAAGVELTVYYTPYTRGAISRIAVLKNTGDSPVKLNRLVLGLPVGDSRAKVETLADGLTVVKSERGDHGFYSLYPTEATLKEFDDGRMVVGADLSTDGITLDCGESFYAPQLVTAFSDNGTGGIARIFHDIIRESDGDLPERSPIVLFTSSYKNAQKLASVVAGTGIDTLAVECMCSELRAVGKNAAADVARAVKSAGLKFGLSVGVEADLSADAARDMCFSAVSDLVDASGADYLHIYTVGGEKPSTYSRVAGKYSLYKRFREAFPSLTVETGALATFGRGGVKELLREKCASPLPACAVRRAVEPPTSSSALPLKTQFDLASLGRLAYRFDGSEVTEGVLRAVRAQVYSYQDDAALIASGDIYDICGGTMAVSKDKSRAYAVCGGPCRLTGLDEHDLYHVRELDKTFSGAALIRYGLALSGVKKGETATLHLRQVADYE